MTSVFSDSIYQHSGETEKVKFIAEQASINEDLEQRRRQLDAQGETRKIIVAKEVATMIDTTGPVQLKHSISELPKELPKEPLLQQAQNTASNALFSALETGKSILQSVAAEAELAAEKVAGAVTHAGMDAANALSSVTKDAAGRVSHASKDAADFVSHAAHEAASQAANIAEKVVDTTTSTASAVGQNALALAEGAANKAYSVADNITYFATLVSVLALEENERARRLASGEEAIAATNAFRMSELIRDLGLNSYGQEIPNLNYGTKLLEEMERRWRLSSPGSSFGESNARSLGKIVSSNLDSFMPRKQWVQLHIKAAEERERSRRLHDTNEIYAILNALSIASLFYELDPCFYRQLGSFGRTHQAYATTLLEENERRSRIKAYKLHHAAEDSAHLLMDVVANNIEKFNYSTRNAARVANEFANKIGNATLSVASALSSRTKDLAQTASERVRGVAGDIAHFTSIMYIVALEESERARRSVDPMEVYAIENAWKQSAIIRGLEGFYKAKSPAIYPTRLLEEHERRWRLASITSARSSAVARMVKANIAKFEIAQQHSAQREHARETAARSRLNPNAPEFVPLHTVKFEGAAKTAPIVKNMAAGAQL